MDRRKAKKTFLEKLMKKLLLLFLATSIGTLVAMNEPKTEITLSLANGSRHIVHTIAPDLKQIDLFPDCNWDFSLTTYSFFPLRVFSPSGNTYVIFSKRDQNTQGLKLVISKEYPVKKNGNWAYGMQTLAEPNADSHNKFELIINPEGRLINPKCASL